MEETCFSLNCLGSFILSCISSSHQYPMPSSASHPSPSVSNGSLFLYPRARSPPHFYLSSFIFLSCFVSREGRRRMMKTIGVCMGNSLTRSYNTTDLTDGILQGFLSYTVPICLCSWITGFMGDRGSVSFPLVGSQVRKVLLLC